MTLTAIEQLMKEKTGIDAQITGCGSLQHFVHRRMEALSILSLNDYYKVLSRSEEELQELVNLITVPETWFFRDAEPFNYLKEFIEKHWLLSNSQEQISVLSLPCSTGEEPYSIAMTLLECGIPEKQIHIDAYDINLHSLEKAKRAIYRDNSFRVDDLSFRERYFYRVDEGYQLSESIINTVHFHHGNALEIQSLCKGRFYNIIFCRNLLIYFNKDTQNALLFQLDALLLKNGRLFLGHSEASEVVMDIFSQVGVKGSFAYQKKTKSLFSFPASPGGTSLSDNKKRKGKKLTHKTAMVSQGASKKLRVIKPIDNSLIKDIERKADNGELDEAAKLCGLLVEQGIEDANALCLCGVIDEAVGNWGRACSLFQKALEIDPNHYDAAIHLAESLQAQGRDDEAQAVRQRAKNIANKREQKE